MPKPPSNKPVSIELDTEDYDGYLMRLAAAYIRAYAPEQPVIHDGYDDTDPVTGEELASSLVDTADERRKEIEKTGMSMELTGTIIQAGTDEETGKPSLTIRTNEHQLRRQKSIPFYRPCEIRFTPIAGH
jgi:hypothetical protein